MQRFYITADAVYGAIDHRGAAFTDEHVLGSYTSL